MNIIVIMKETFDTEELITLKDGVILDNKAKFVINPYDEYAIEEAVQLKEQFGGEVTVISVGPTRVEESLRSALAVGADHAILVDDEALFGDEYTVSKVLAAIVKDISFDLILGGNMSVDSGAGQVAKRLAQQLDLNHVDTVTNLTVEGEKIILERDVEGNTEIIEATFPLLVTAQQGLNEPRYPSLPGIMKAKKKPIQHISAADLGLNAEDIKAKTVTLDQFLPLEKASGKLIDGEVAEQAKELAQLLRQEAKVI